MQNSKGNTKPLSGNTKLADNRSSNSSIFDLGSDNVQIRSSLKTTGCEKTNISLYFTDNLSNFTGRCLELPFKILVKCIEVIEQIYCWKLIFFEALYFNDEVNNLLLDESSYGVMKLFHFEHHYWITNQYFQDYWKSIIEIYNLNQYFFRDEYFALLLYIEISELFTENFKIKSENFQNSELCNKLFQTDGNGDQYGGTKSLLKGHKLTEMMNFKCNTITNLFSWMILYETFHRIYQSVFKYLNVKKYSKMTEKQHDITNRALLSKNFNKLYFLTSIGLNSICKITNYIISPIYQVQQNTPYSPAKACICSCNCNKSAKCGYSLQCPIDTLKTNNIDSNTEFCKCKYATKLIENDIDHYSKNMECKCDSPECVHYKKTIKEVDNYSSKPNNNGSEVNESNIDEHLSDQNVSLCCKNPSCDEISSVQTKPQNRQILIILNSKSSPRESIQIIDRRQQGTIKPTISLMKNEDRGIAVQKSDKQNQPSDVFRKSPRKNSLTGITKSRQSITDLLTEEPMKAADYLSNILLGRPTQHSKLMSTDKMKEKVFRPPSNSQLNNAASNNKPSDVFRKSPRKKNLTAESKPKYSTTDLLTEEPMKTADYLSNILLGRPTQHRKRMSTDKIKEKVFRPPTNSQLNNAASNNKQSDVFRKSPRKNSLTGITKSRQSITDLFTEEPMKAADYLSNILLGRPAQHTKLMSTDKMKEKVFRPPSSSQLNNAASNNKPSDVFRKSPRRNNLTPGSKPKYSTTDLLTEEPMKTADYLSNILLGRPTQHRKRMSTDKLKEKVFRPPSNSQLNNAASNNKPSDVFRKSPRKNSLTGITKSRHSITDLLTEEPMKTTDYLSNIVLGRPAQVRKLMPTDESFDYYTSQNLENGALNNESTIKDCCKTLASKLTNCLNVQCQNLNMTNRSEIITNGDKPDVCWCNLKTQQLDKQNIREDDVREITPNVREIVKSMQQDTNPNFQCFQKNYLCEKSNRCRTNIPKWQRCCERRAFSSEKTLIQSAPEKILISIGTCISNSVNNQELCEERCYKYMTTKLREKQTRNTKKDDQKLFVSAEIIDDVSSDTIRLKTGDVESHNESFGIIRKTNSSKWRIYLLKVIEKRGKSVQSFEQQTTFELKESQIHESNLCQCREESAKIPQKTDFSDYNALNKNNTPKWKRCCESRDFITTNNCIATIKISTCSVGVGSCIAIDLTEKEELCEEKCFQYIKAKLKQNEIQQIQNIGIEDKKTKQSNLDVPDESILNAGDVKLPRKCCDRLKKTSNSKWRIYLLKVIEENGKLTRSAQTDNPPKKVFKATPIPKESNLMQSNNEINQGKIQDESGGENVNQKAEEVRCPISEVEIKSFDMLEERYHSNVPILEIKSSPGCESPMDLKQNQKFIPDPEKEKNYQPNQESEAKSVANTLQGASQEDHIEHVQLSKKESQKQFEQITKPETKETEFPPNLGLESKPEADSEAVKSNQVMKKHVYWQSNSNEESKEHLEKRTESRPLNTQEKQSTYFDNNKNACGRKCELIQEANCKAEDSSKNVKNNCCKLKIQTNRYKSIPDIDKECLHEKCSAAQQSWKPNSKNVTSCDIQNTNGKSGVSKSQRHEISSCATNGNVGSQSNKRIEMASHDSTSANVSGIEEMFYHVGTDYTIPSDLRKLEHVFDLPNVENKYYTQNTFKEGVSTVDRLKEPGQESLPEQALERRVSQSSSNTKNDLNISNNILERLSAFQCLCKCSLAKCICQGKKACECGCNFTKCIHKKITEN